MECFVKCKPKMYSATFNSSIVITFLVCTLMPSLRLIKLCVGFIRCEILELVNFAGSENYKSSCSVLECIYKATLLL